MTVYTINPDAHPETSSVDGDVSRQVAAESWASIRAGAGTHSDDSSIQMYSGYIGNPVTNQWTENYRTILLFDLSSIPSTDIAITAFVILESGVVGGGIVDEGHTNPYFGIYSCNPATNTALIGADYSTMTFTLLSDLLEGHGLSGGDNIWTLNATGLALINAAIAAGGVVKLALLTHYDGTGTAPTGDAATNTRLPNDQADTISGVPPVLRINTFPGVRVPWVKII